MEYELIREIPNSCQNNQMRDVFFEEIECEDPLSYIESLFGGTASEIREDIQADGNTVIYVTVDDMIQKYIFTKI